MKKAAAAISVLAVLQGCGLVSSPVYLHHGVSAGTVVTSGLELRGIASWYGIPFHGRKTANGETYDMNGLTCAHRTLPFGTVLIVTNMGNNRSVTVRVTDRGPFISGRIVDLSRGAAAVLGMLDTGTALVTMKVVGNE
ncbi:MAG: septal ring lytic transglycosylase RlpA family protein [Candidatus Sabulitectum sp.]|nr:septal ring lytic transglycosylase RlpA family protein [Candidatus Sabulitectum sp.]